MKKAELNYWIDVSIAITFVLSAISGLVFLLPVGFESGILGIGYSFWSQLHTWSSVGMVAGVLAHLMLHWKWIIGMTKKKLFPKRGLGNTSPVAAVVTMRRVITRRRFLSLGLAALFAGVIAASYSVFAGEQAVDNTGQDDEQGLSLQQESDTQVTDERSSLQQGGVACPRGLVNDPYPGRCRHYTDRDGGGICDYSVPGTGSN